MTIEQIKEQLKNTTLFDGLTFNLTLTDGSKQRILVSTDEFAERPCDDESFYNFRVVQRHGIRYDIGYTMRDTLVSDIIDEFPVLDDEDVLDGLTDFELAKKFIRRHPDKFLSVNLFLYEHSGTSWSISDFNDRFDSSCVGVMYMPLKDLAYPENAQEQFDWCVKQYLAYLNCEIYKVDYQTQYTEETIVIRTSTDNPTDKNVDTHTRNIWLTYDTSFNYFENDVIEVFYNLPTVDVENITKIEVGHIDEN